MAVEKSWEDFKMDNFFGIWEDFKWTTSLGFGMTLGLGPVLYMYSESIQPLSVLHSGL